MHEAQQVHQGRRLGSGKKLLERPRRLFEFTLALALGKTHRQLLRECDAAELAEWEAFWTIRPFGDEWRQVARLATCMCTAWGAKNLEEEMLMPSHRKPPQTREQMMAELHKVFGGRG